MLQLKKDVDLSQRNSFRLKSSCDYFITLHSKDDVLELVSSQIFKDASQFFILGGGSNVILPEKFNGLVIHPDFKDLIIEDVSKDSVRVSVGSGVDWQYLVDFTLDNACYGLENLSLIPGKVGAAPIQNIGAYGVEVAEYIESVDVYDFEKKNFFSLAAANCEFEYRSSVFKKFPLRYLIVSVNFMLSRKEHLNSSYKAVQDYLSKSPIDESTLSARQLSDIIKQIRRERLPNPELNPNVGSFFKNPVIAEGQFHKLKLAMQAEVLKKMPAFPQEDGRVKLSAAWLLDQCGFKGQSYKNLCVSSRHALVMENCGESTQKDVLEFSQLIKGKVKESFFVELEMEPVIK